MLVLLSPAKKQNFDPQRYAIKTTQPAFKKQVIELVDALKPLSNKQLQKLMSLSDSLTQLNHQRYQDFDTNSYTSSNAKPAAFALRGDAYQGLQIDDFNASELEYLQQHLVILSGLYGALRPMDLIQPYRLEMKTKLACNGNKDLYQFWQQTLTKKINQRINKEQHKAVINLASNEYFKAINHKQLDAPIITVQFKEKKDNAHKMIGIYAKRARGLMTRYIAKHQLTKAQQLQKFDSEDYRFNPALSTDTEWTFTRCQA